MTEEIALVQTTLPDLASAQRIARALIETKDAACVQISPIMSIYRWDGQTEETKEFRLDIKTSNKMAATLLAKVERLHPFDVPEIIVLSPAKTSVRYGQWVQTETA